MKTLIRLIAVVGLLQMRCLTFAQTVNESRYIFTFSPVYSSGLIDMNFIAYDDLILVVSEMPVNIDSIMCVLSKKKYNSLSRILDTLRQQFRIYDVVISPNEKNKRDKIVTKLTDYSNYKTGYLFTLSDEIKKHSSVVGYVIHRYSSEREIRYKVLNKNCGDFPNVCQAIITKL